MTPTYSHITKRRNKAKLFGVNDLAESNIPENIRQVSD